MQQQIDQGSVVEMHMARKNQAALVLPFMVCGFGLTWGALFVFAYSFIFSPSPAAENPQSSLAGLCFLLGIVISELIICRNFRFIRNKKIRQHLALAAVICVAIMTAGLVLSEYRSIPMPFIVVLALLPGLWEGVFHVLWGEAFAASGISQSTRYLYASVVLGALIFIFITITGNSLNEPIVTLFAVIFSYVCLRVTYNYLPSLKGGGIRAGEREELEIASAKLEKTPLKTGASLAKRSQESVATPATVFLQKKNVSSRQQRIYLTLFLVYGVVFGFGLSHIIIATSGARSFLAIGIALAGGVAVLLVLEVFGRHDIAFINIARYLLPLLAVELVPIPFVDENVRWLLCLLLIMTITMFDTASFSFLAHRARIKGLSQILVISQGRLFLQLGMFLGSAVNMLLVDIISPFTQYSLYFPPVLVVLLFFTVAFVGSFDPLDMNLSPNKERRSKPDQEPHSPQCRNCTLVYVDKNETSETLSLRYGLSRRERDVLVYLIKGHTAPSIAAIMQLSQSTVKTHIYHIYQKMGIGSKVELITIVEREEVETY